MFMYLYPFIKTKDHAMIRDAKRIDKNMPYSILHTI